MLRFAHLARPLILLALIATGAWIWPQARTAGEWLLAAEDPPALATLGVESLLTSERLASDLAAALDAEDLDLADSFVALAASQSITVPTVLMERYAALSTPSASLARGARDFVMGAITGDVSTDAGLTGSVAGDLTGIGDIRDLLAQGRKLLNGEEADAVVTGIAAAGLVITGATIASLGTASPARAGLSSMKVAIRSGRLSRPLLAELTQSLRATVDARALRAGATAALALDMTAARSALRGAIDPAAVTRVRHVADDLATLGRHARARGALEAAALAQNTGELRRFAQVATHFGPRTRATLKLLGRGAIVLGAQAAVFAAWLVSALVLAIAALFSVLTMLENAVFALVRTHGKRSSDRRTRGSWPDRRRQLARAYA
jgi:hypothetical protein